MKQSRAFKFVVQLIANAIIAAMTAWILSRIGPLYVAVSTGIIVWFVLVHGNEPSGRS